MYRWATVHDKSQCEVVPSTNINIFLSNTCYYMRQLTFAQRHFKYTLVPSNMSKNS